MIEDLRHALRIYLSTPFASGVAVVVLAIAMACVSSLLSLYSDLVLKPHPGFERSGELVTIGRSNGENFMPLSRSLLESIREEIASLETITGTGGFNLTLEPGGSMLVEAVATDFFRTMRPRLQLGRGLADADNLDGAEPVVVVSDRYWREQLGAREDVLGQTITVTGTPFMIRFDPDGEPEPPEEQSRDYRIVGVMSPAYAGTTAETAAWLPFNQAAPIFFGTGDAIDRSSMLYSYARLESPRRLGAVVNELNGRFAERMEEFNSPPGSRFDATTGVVRNIRQQTDATRQVSLLLAGGVLLALVAASNVSLFLLSRAPGRRRELGVRLSVGAPMRRLARQLATEAAVLVLVAAALGLLISVWLTVLLQDLPFLAGAQWRDVGLDWRVLALVGVLTLGLTALVSVGPALGLRRLGIAESARAVSARPGLTQHLAGNVQIGAACIVAAVAVAFSWYLTRLMTDDHGYTTEDLLLVQLEPPEGQRFVFNAGFDEVIAERERRRETVLGLPGVDAVGFGTAVPGRSTFGISGRFDPDDSPVGETVSFRIISADAAYAEILEMPLLHGRLLAPTDGGGMLVNESLARAMWGRVDVVGETFGDEGFVGNENLQVVGVLADVPFGHPSDDSEPIAFIYTSPFSRLENILIRSRSTPASLRAELERAIDSGALGIEIASIDRMSSIKSALLAADTSRSALAVATAGLVVVLAVFGFYGTQRFLVAAGRREYAILAALGAGPRALGREVLKRALLLGLPGLAFGSVLGFIAVAWMRDDFLSADVSPLVVAAAVAAAMIVLLLAASVGPARLARRTDPGPLLKQD